MARQLILCCDGGGVRGALTSQLLATLCTEVPSFYGKVGLFGGTSTGGMISTALASGIEPDQLVGFYTELAGKAFTPNAPPDLTRARIVIAAIIAIILGSMLEGAEAQRQSLEDQVADALPRAMALVSAGERSLHRAARQSIEASPQAVSGFEWKLLVIAVLALTMYVLKYFFAKYQSGPLEALLADKIGRRPLPELRPLVVTTFRISADGASHSWLPTVMTNLAGGALRAAADEMGLAVETAVTSVDAALSTGAAPTYFPSHHLGPASGTTNYVDGGTYANNPSMVTLSMALASGTPLDDVRLLSLGTGDLPISIETRGPLDWGPIPWMFGWDPFQSATGNFGVPPILNLALDGPQQAVSLQCRQVLKGHFQRANVRLREAVALDDVAAIPRLVQWAKDYAVSSNPDWVATVNWAREAVA